MSNKPSRNPFSPPDPDAPPRAPNPHQDQEDSGEGQGNTPPDSPTPPSFEDLKQASGATFRFGAILILTLLSSQLPLPYTLVSPVLVVVAVVYGIIALRRSWAISPRNLMTPMLVVGIIMSLMISLSVVSKIALWPVEMERQECVKYALTNTAQAECEANYEQAVDDRLKALRNLAPGS